MKEKQNVVYILKCADGTLYTGWSSDLNNRLKAHQNGKGAKYTRYRRPVTLVYREILPDKQSALKREHQIKQLTREQKLKLTNKLAADNK